MGWEKVAKVSDLSDGEAKPIEVGGTIIALFKIDGKFHCTAGKCTHRGGPLGEGKIEEKQITCPWHAAKFDITTGKVIAPPAKEDVKTYQVKVEGNDVLVNLE